MQIAGLDVPKKGKKKEKEKKRKETKRKPGLNMGCWERRFICTFDFI